MAGIHADAAIAMLPLNQWLGDNGPTHAFKLCISVAIFTTIQTL